MAAASLNYPAQKLAMSTWGKTIGEIPVKNCSSPVKYRFFTGEKPSNGFSPTPVPQRANVTFDRIDLHYLAGLLVAVLPVIVNPSVKLTGKRRQTFRFGLLV